ncbi:MAG: DUF2974 domain-containing protein [Lachnospiraceae bacterium]|nr:DUF2974 domain-containing protein [Lachnospiraceae bacterium]
MSNKGNVIDYVWKDRSPLTADNYNEIDGLVMSELSYMKFEDITWTEEQLSNGITIEDYAQILLDNSSNLGENERSFLGALKIGTRYKNLKVTDMAALNGNEYWSNGQTHHQSESGQWAGLTVEIDDRTCIVANRGTDTTTRGWNEDLELAYTTTGTPAQIASRDYLENNRYDNVYDVGHSKGANDSVSGYAMADKSTRDRVKRIDTYDGPGNNDEFIGLHEEGYSELADKQHNHFPKDSIIGTMLNDHPGENDYCNTNTNPNDMSAIFSEHDPFSWSIDLDSKEFDGNADNQSDISRLINDSLDDALDGLGPDGRRTAVDILQRIGVASLMEREEDMSTGAKILRILAGLMSLSDGEVAAILMFLFNLLRDMYLNSMRIRSESYKYTRAQTDGSRYAADAAPGRSRFSVSTDILRHSMVGMRDIAQQIDMTIPRFDAVNVELGSFIHDEIMDVLSALRYDMLKERRSILDLHDCIEYVALEYESTEEEILSRPLWVPSSAW